MELIGSPSCTLVYLYIGLYFLSRVNKCVCLSFQEKFVISYLYICMCTCAHTLIHIPNTHTKHSICQWETDKKSDWRWKPGETKVAPQGVSQASGSTGDLSSSTCLLEEGKCSEPWSLAPKTTPSLCSPIHGSCSPIATDNFYVASIARLAPQLFHHWCKPCKDIFKDRRFKSGERRNCQSYLSRGVTCLARISLAAFFKIWSTTGHISRSQMK